MLDLTPYQKEALNYKSNILLSANAGSGKTFVLSKRFVEIIINEEVELDSLVAITFTDKAAGELNKKIADEIDQRIYYESNETLKNKLENFRRQLVSANISTIHSFCINILREFAPEAEIDANFIPIDQSTSDELIELSVDETVGSLINNPDYTNELKYLIRFFGSKRVLSNHLQDAVGQRKLIDQHLKDLYRKIDSEISKYFCDTFDRTFPLVFSPIISTKLNDIKVINDFVIQCQNGNPFALEISKLLEEYEPDRDVNSQLDYLKKIDENLLTQKGLVKNRGYLNREREQLELQINRVESFFSDIRLFCENQKSKNAENELARFGKYFIKVFYYILNLYSEKKYQKGYLDFEDMLLFTQRILEKDEVQEHLQKKFKYIMIDEYQDTNELQYRIFMPILDNLKQGNLFVVGDEKQSIYKFRDAELEVFNKTKDDIENLGIEGRILELPHSFRMAPQLVLFTNILFSELFSSPNLLLNEVAYNELICAKNPEEKGKVEFLLSEIDGEVTEAEFVANKILELVTERKNEIQLKDIGILCRKRSSFAKIENAFVKKKIPYSVVGGKGFYQRQVIADIYNYLSFLLNEDDDSALIGVLRSPFFIVSDTKLFEISLEEGTNFFEKLKKKALNDPDMQRSVDQLIKHKQLAYSSEIYSLVRVILSESGYWSVVSSMRNADQEIANIEKLLAIARDYSKKSFKNLFDFTVYLREAIETLEDEGQAQISKDENTVKILTIHQAKGLEYKVVFLFGCNEYTMDDSVKTRSLSIDKNFGLLTKVPLDNNYFYQYYSAPIVNLYNYINHKKNIAEIKRLLYVAVTRAMNYLFISATHSEFKHVRDSFFELLKDGLKLDCLKDELFLEGQVQFIHNKDDKYEFYQKPVTITIPINKQTREMPLVSFETEHKDQINRSLIQKITDIPESEIISATKISMFTQCPVKYELTYEIGYSSIIQLVKKYQNDYEFNSKEDDELRAYADVKGRLIHSILKTEGKLENLEYLVGRLLLEESIKEEASLNKIKEKVIYDLLDFYHSALYKDMTAYSNYKNEFEVYCEEGEHYLYGIIDKLIYENDKLIIIDYKTDDISADQIRNRADEYFPQLQFYAYILSKFYTQHHDFELKLIFIKHPNDAVSKFIDDKDLVEFKKSLNDSVIKIFKRDYKPNFRHCSKCHFALEGNKCVKNIL